MVHDATEHGVGVKRIGSEKFSNPQEENELIGKVNLKNLPLAVAGVSQTKPEDVGLEEPEKDDAFTMEQELGFSALARSILESRGEMINAGRKVFSSYQRALRVEKVASLKQTIVIDHFQIK